MSEAEKILSIAQEQRRASREINFRRNRRINLWLRGGIILLFAIPGWIYTYSHFFHTSLVKYETTPVSADGVIVNMSTKHRCGRYSDCDSPVYFLIGETKEGQCYVAYWPSGWNQPYCAGFLYALESDDCPALQGPDRAHCEQLFRDVKRPNASMRRAHMILEIHNSRAIDGNPTQ